MIAGLGGAAIAFAQNHGDSTRTALLGISVLTGLLASAGMLTAVGLDSSPQAGRRPASTGKATCRLLDGIR
ncbi:hypothetical protein ACIRRH_40485 [Kitasatospora sp. NPDC101235]|uniref:hypothetical protein n=1 Tax=Kitasatospora sp. NPDC101235 TaxID=3364101 RepID=UPI003826690A